MGKIPVLIRMSGEIRREVRYRESPGVLGGECRGGREVERNEYAQGDISHVTAGAYLIVNKVKGGRQVKQSEGVGHLIVAETSMRLISGVSVMVHSRRG